LVECRSWKPSMQLRCARYSTSISIGAISGCPWLNGLDLASLHATCAGPPGNSDCHGAGAYLCKRDSRAILDLSRPGGPLSTGTRTRILRKRWPDGQPSSIR
jgi:hypothetical protein